MALGQVLAGNIIYADDVQDELDALTVTKKYKTADQSVTNLTTLTNDSDLYFTPGINTVWQVKWVLLYSGTTTEDGKVALTFPTGATCPWSCLAYSTALVTVPVAFDATVSSGSAFGIGGNGASNTLVATLEATLTMSSTAGDLRLQFAQNVAGVGTSMTVRKGSRMIARQLA